MIPERAMVWGLRILVIAGLVALCALAGSSNPTIAFSLAWGPNGLFLMAYTKGALRLPRLLERVHPIEPALYHLLGAGLVKRVVATRMWPLLIGFDDLPPKPRNRGALIAHVDEMTKGAEVCHAATFILAGVVGVVCLAYERYSAAFWIFVFNFALNGYPVMLQRANRWRVQQIRSPRTIPGGAP